MSAAEKLRALDEALVDAPWFYEAGMAAGMDRTGSVWARPENMLTLVMSKPHYNPALELMALRNALPQIVAVTLWAEQTIQNFDEYGEVSFIPLIDALEELDKALS